MTCSRSAKRARWQTLLTKYQAQMDVLDAAVLAGLTEIGQYKLETGEGSQMVKYVNPDDLLKIQNRLQSQIDRLERMLCGGGLTRISVNRRGNCY